MKKLISDLVVVLILSAIVIAGSAFLLPSKSAQHRYNGGSYRATERPNDSLPRATASGNQAVSQQPSDTGNQADHERQRGSIFSLLDGKATDWILVVTTIVLAIIGYFQLLTYRDQAAIMRAAQRASVFVSGVDFEQARGWDGQIREYIVSVIWENSGQTATTRLLSYVCGKGLGPDGMPEDFKFPDLLPEGMMGPVLFSRTTLPARGKAVAGRASIHVVDVEKLIQRSETAYVWGWCEYDDGLSGSKRRRTEFCFEIVARGKPTEAILDWRIHGRHNGADDECMRKVQPYEARIRNVLT